MYLKQEIKVEKKNLLLRKMCFCYLASSVFLMRLLSNHRRDIIGDRTNGSEEEFSSYLIGFAGSLANVT